MEEENGCISNISFLSFGRIFQLHDYLLGGFNPFEKYQSSWIISPGKGENKQ